MQYLLFCNDDIYYYLYEKDNNIHLKSNAKDNDKQIIIILTSIMKPLGFKELRELYLKYFIPYFYKDFRVKYGSRNSLNQSKQSDNILKKPNKSKKDLFIELISKK